MNKLVFKVNGPKDGNLSSLLKAITKIKCRIYLDIENGSVTVENVHDDFIDSVIDLINEYYVLLGVEIDTILEEERVVLSVEEFPLEDSDEKEPEAKPEVTEVKESEAESSEEHAPNITIADVVPTTREVEPQGPEDLIVKKIEFQNTAIENAINKLANTAYWAMYKQCGSEREIVNHIWTSIREMSLKYDKADIIEFSFGDIVECYFGTHLLKEINGAHVHGIVADIKENNLVYIVPITKATENIDTPSYITFSGGVDVDYYSDRYNNGSVLIDKARYIRAERLNSVVGKAKPEFLTRLIDKLSGTFNFKHNLLAVSEDISSIETSNENVENTLPAVHVEEAANSNRENIIEPQKNVESAKNNMTGEDTLMLVVGDALKLLEPGGSILSNTRTFLEEIGMPTDNPILNEAFLAAYTIKKINYENIIAAVRQTNNELSEEVVKETLQKAFKNWCATKEELESYNRLAITSLLKLFAKSVRA